MLGLTSTAIYLLLGSKARTELINLECSFTVKGIKFYNSNGKIAVPLSLKHS